MAYKVKGGEPKTIDIEDGLHKGKIITIDDRTPEGKDYSYLDVFIRTDVKLDDGKDLELKVGYPLPEEGEGVSPNSALGELISRFTGDDVEIDKEYELEDILVGKQVQFQTLTNKKGYAEILKQTLKLAVPQTKEIKPEESQ